VASPEDASGEKSFRRIPLGLHTFALTSPCHQIIVALEALPLIGTDLVIHCALLEEKTLLEGAVLITIRVQRSQENSL